MKISDRLNSIHLPRIQLENQPKPPEVFVRNEPGIFTNIFNSREPGMVVLRLIVLSLVLVVFLLKFIFIIQAAHPPHVYKKDILQEYLLAKAVLAGVDPYLPIPVLAQLFIGEVPVPLLPHPTPHPPPLAILCLPLAILPFPQAALAWLLFELICLVWIARRIYPFIKGKAEWAGIAALALLFIAWTPFFEDLLYGQLMIFMLALLVESWLASKRGQHGLAGIILGVAISIKFVAWPILLFLVLKRNWKASIGAVLTLATLHLAAAAAMGIGPTANYYLQTGEGIFPFYKAFMFNFSTWSIGWRIFEGTGSTVLEAIEAPALFYAPELAPYVSIGLSISVLVISTLLALRSSHIDSAFAIMVAVSIIISPIVWIHFFVLAALPMAVAIKNIRNQGYPFRITLAMVSLLSLSIIPIQFLNVLLLPAPQFGDGGMVPLSITLLAMIPVILVSCLIYLIWAGDKTLRNEQI
jgi:hypothetical protein